ncbi:MAG: hypothetical protein ACRENN_08745 [Candidatus Eiseniibacteriota bacterium]
MKRILLALCGLVILSATAQPAAAKGNMGGYIGFCTSPDDFMVGLRWTNPLGEDNLFLVPSAEVGFGDVTMIAGNLDLHYRFKSSSATKFYAGGGVTLNFFDFDGGSSTDFGGSILGGILLKANKSGKQPFFEVKLGLGDVPDAKFIAGLNF